MGKLRENLLHGRDGEFKILDTMSQNSLNDVLFRYFRSASLSENGPFVEGIEHFLMFDQVYITDPYSFGEFVSRDPAPGMFIGYLLVEQERPAIIPSGCFYISKESSTRHVLRVFQEQPVGISDGPLSASVTSGFVTSATGDWALWFSSYWEVAIAGFWTVRDAEAFMSFHRDIKFMTNDMIAEYYSSNPESQAPKFLSRYLERNAGDLACG